jgi:eukaryotic-like serine/threonine-protein kinase
MSLSCSHCSRTITLTRGDDAPLFCMYCGQKLRSTVADGDATQQFSPALRNLLKVPGAEYDFANTRTVDPQQDTEAVVEDSVAPKQVSGFRLVRFIGGGGMGNVYEAINTENGQRVAVKLLSKRLANNPSSNERFRQEGRLASQIMHPRCVFVLRADTDNGRPFIVMELMPGETLKDLVDRKGPMPVEQAITAMLDVIDGLIEAHRLGVIHRDVKPSNCFLEANGRVKVGDFGLSKSLTGEQHEKQLTGSGTFLGTVLFAAPEQIKHEPVGYDSDVYSVAATLYYMLIGKAPHQHESLTAVLAKVISEPAPSLRAQRPDIPKSLDKIILKGLERDRTRRFSTLEEFRRCLQEQLPSAQVPARLRSLLLAYCIDIALLQLVYIIVEVVLRLVFNVGYTVDNLNATPVYQILIAVFYFLLFEGFLAATPGKILMRLRVRRLGMANAPGLHWAGLRSLVFNALWLIGPLFALLCHLLNLDTLGFLLGGLGWIVTILLLLIQIRRTELGYRGLHDFASGTRTVALGLRERPTQLVSQRPAPLDHTIPSPPPLPAKVGMFTVQGKLCDVDDGGEIWLGEDPSLGRRVLMRIEPAGTGDDSLYDEPIVRPTRLRSVGHGTVAWKGAERAWVAYVAPTGAPLTDIVTADKPLSWSDSDKILDQLLVELIEGEQSFTNPPSLTVEQIWVEPNGRVQLLDFPIPTGVAVAAGETRSRYPRGTTDTGKFLKSSISLMLEGSPRTTKQPLAAPLPPRVGGCLNDFFQQPDPPLEEFRKKLARHREQPAEVSVSQRVGQLSVQGLLVTVGLLAMFTISAFMTLFISFGFLQFYDRCAAISDAIDTPEERAALLVQAKNKWTRPEQQEKLERFEKAMEPEAVAVTLATLGKVVSHKDETRQKMEARLGPLEQPLFKLLLKTNIHGQSTLEEIATPLILEDDGVRKGFQFKVNGKLIEHAEERIVDFDREMANAIWPFTIFLLVWPVVLWPLFAFCFRGGLSYLVGGIAIVRKSGRPAARWRCALRALLAWLPLTAILFACLFVQLYYPTAVALRTTLLVVALVLLPLMVVMALRNPARGPHDKLLGTFLVPN